MGAEELAKKFSIPRMDFFTSKNVMTGSLQDFNFKITPGEQLCAVVWYGKFCSEKSEIAAKADFGMEPEGREQLLCWLEDRYQDYFRSTIKKG